MKKKKNERLPYPVEVPLVSFSAIMSGKGGKQCPEVILGLVGRLKVVIRKT